MPIKPKTRPPASLRGTQSQERPEMKPFLSRPGHSRACQPDPCLSSFPEEGAGETQPFSLQSASCPRRCWCRSGYPHPSLPPFWKHTFCRPATAPAHQRTPRPPSPPAEPRHRLSHPVSYWRARSRWGRSMWPRLLKALVGAPLACVGWGDDGGRSGWGGVGRGGADVSEPGGNVRKDSLWSPSPGSPRPHSLSWGGGCFLRLGCDLPP